MEVRLPADAFQAWLNSRRLTPDHIEAIREVHRSFAFWTAAELAEEPQHDYSYLVAAIASDWEAEMLIAMAGYPVQALALVRGTLEKLAFLRIFMRSPQEADSEHRRLLNPTLFFVFTTKKMLELMRASLANDHREDSSGVQRQANE